MFPRFAIAIILVIIIIASTGYAAEKYVQKHPKAAEIVIPVWLVSAVLELMSLWPLYSFLHNQ